MAERQPAAGLEGFMAGERLELRDGRLWRDTRWFGEPLPAPAWRAQWVERVEGPPPEAT